MNTKAKLTGLALATAAAGMFAMATPMTASAGEAQIHCVGVNSCKGTSDCATANSACKGQNSCKGHGFVALTEGQCKQIGGAVES